MQTCRPAKCIEAIRVALLDQCTFTPVPGALNGYAMGCIIDPNWTPEIEEGEESVVKDNCGNICLRDDRGDQIKRWNLEFKIKQPDEEFLALIGGDTLIVNAGQSVGVQHVAQGVSPYVFVELFEKTDQCGIGGAPVYFRHVFPAARLKWTGNEREGIFRILQIEGKTLDRPLSSVGTGPFDDIAAFATVAAAGARSDYFWYEDSVVPAIQCGAIEVPEPVVPFSITQFLSNGYSDSGSILELFKSEQDGSSNVSYGLPAGWTANLSEMSFSADRLAYAIHGEGAGGVDELVSLRDSATNALITEFNIGATNSAQMTKYVAVSPDKSTIAYSLIVAGAGPLPRIETLDDTTARVTVTSGGVAYTGPSYSPDGLKLAYGIYDGVDWKIQIAAADGSGIIATTTAVFAGGLGIGNGRTMWSPDSSLVYVMADHDATFTDVTLSTVNATTGVVTTVATIPHVGGEKPYAWDISTDASVAVFAQFAGSSSYRVSSINVGSGLVTVRSAMILDNSGSVQISIRPDGLFSVSQYNNGNSPGRDSGLAVVDLSGNSLSVPFTFALPGDESARSIENVAWRGVPAP